MCSKTRKRCRDHKVDFEVAALIGTDDQDREASFIQETGWYHMGQNAVESSSADAENVG